MGIHEIDQGSHVIYKENLEPDYSFHDFHIS